jgi:hypothetical protein
MSKRSSGQVPGWLETTVCEFTAGVALAIGIVGLVRTGRDVWLGAALVLLAFIFSARGAAISHVRRSGAGAPTSGVSAPESPRAAREGPVAGREPSGSEEEEP